MPEAWAWSGERDLCPGNAAALTIPESKDPLLSSLGALGLKHRNES